jgi:phage head maturation protease
VREFGNALVDTIERVHSIEYEEGKREVAKIFGFKSLTAKTDSVVDAAFKETIASGRVVREGNDLRIGHDSK